MIEMLERIGGLFVVPSSPSVADRAAAVSAVSVGLLCESRDALTAGSAMALLLARRHRVPCAALYLWPSSAIGGGIRLPSSRAARRLANALSAHGLEASTAGRIARVGLTQDPQVAAVEISRAISVAGDTPFVLVLAGPRNMALDGLLQRCDVVATVVDASSWDPPLGPLIETSLAQIHRRVRALEVSIGPATAVMARSGLAVSGSLSRSFGPVI